MNDLSHPSPASPISFSIPEENTLLTGMVSSPRNHQTVLGDEAASAIQSRRIIAIFIFFPLFFFRNKTTPDLPPAPGLAWDLLPLLMAQRVLVAVVSSFLDLCLMVTTLHGPDPEPVHVKEMLVDTS